MNLKEKSLKVREIFEELEIEVSSYLLTSKLNCFSGCGHCCANPKVNASVLEFLPLAFDLCEKGTAEQTLTVLNQMEENEGYCLVYKATSPDGQSGYCSDYNNRGLICRLFGNSSRRNKLGEKELLICRKLKEGKADRFQKVSQAINLDLDVPSATNTYAKLLEIDSILTEEQFPINVAIKKALEAVLRFKYYEQNQEF